MKYLIVSGAAGDIGKEIANVYLDDGYKVIGIDKLDISIERKNYNFVNVDLISFCNDLIYRKKRIKEIKNYISDEIEELIIINNAAIQILSNFKKITNEDWNKTLTVNLVAPSLIVQDFLDELRLSKGQVLNISSIHAKLTKKMFTYYAASKSALESLTRSMSLELAQHKIKVNCVAPAAVETDMLKEGFKNNSDKLELLKKYHPTNTIGQPADLAAFIKSITDNKTDFLTGAIIDFNGGISSKLHDPE